MKKFLCTVAFVMALLFVMSSTSFAAAEGWTITITKVAHYKYKRTSSPWFTWQAECTSDGTALSATNLFILAKAQLSEADFNLFRMACITDMDVRPGTGSTLPNTTINITLSDAIHGTRYSHTAIDQTQDTNQNPVEDTGQCLDVTSSFSLALNDIGDAGDKVTLVFTGWVTWIED